MVIKVGIVNDHELIVAGIRTVLEPFAAQTQVIDLEPRAPARTQVDVLLYDPLFVSTTDTTDLGGSLRPGRLAALGWEMEPDRVDALLRAGVSGYIYKGLAPADFVHAIERVHRGELVVPTGAGSRVESAPLERWPGDHFGLSFRESQIIVMICQGLSNREIADRVFVSINTIKTYIRAAYRKIGIKSRSQAVIWGLGHGFGAIGDRTPAPVAVVTHRALV